MYLDYLTAFVDTPHGRARLTVSESGVVECAWPLLQENEGGGDRIRLPQNPRGSGREYLLWQAVEALLAYFSGDFQAIATVPLDGRKFTPWQRKVYQVVRSIPAGEARSYGEVAAACGRPRAARAVGQAMAANPVPLFIPCHRVIRSDGRAGYYSGGGPALKEWLLAFEKEKTANLFHR
ncbi:methylated-DNA--[protein]-cysteine S-methyltransferase [Thermacetogenium phaeum]|uniref:methylated-DNA--[protein]-cysteine S-methyltransferase n=1 Tax=Thermacetogenium phaeum TaxID=85874 RepID=UPI0002DDB579|nr:methylated-DNA--[protein]-cysteine S-methyltransferase [Thermacetogenium phaeum]